VSAPLVAVLVKGFDEAKTRLGLEPDARRVVAADLALGVLNAVPSGSLVVAGSPEVGAVARALGLEAIVEERPAGQNPAARVAVAAALKRGAPALLVVSSDLPLLNAAVIEAMLERAIGLGSPAVLAAPATGRGGTNALYLAPPDVIDLHFGDDSLRKFEADALARGVRFELFEAEELALDLDEPADLEALRARR
jgi:2-phospho-L-lactate guanylyltransferase